MADHVVDTNVLLVASARDSSSPFDDTHVPAEEQQAVFEWLAAFRADDGRRLVMDARFAIYIVNAARVAEGRFTVAEVVAHLGASELFDGPAEGVHVKRAEGGGMDQRAKVVRASFIQEIDEHWRARPMEVNCLADPSTDPSRRSPRQQ
jgi:hypothetical protein